MKMILEPFVHVLKLMQGIVREGDTKEHKETSKALFEIVYIFESRVKNFARLIAINETFSQFYSNYNTSRVLVL